MYLNVFCSYKHAHMHSSRCAYVPVSDCMFLRNTCTYIKMGGWFYCAKSAVRRRMKISRVRRRNGGPPRKEVAGAKNEPSLRNEGADHQPEPSGLGGVGRSSIIVYSQKMIVTKRLDLRTARRKKSGLKTAPRRKLRAKIH